MFSQSGGKRTKPNAFFALVIFDEFVGLESKPIQLTHQRTEINWGKHQISVFLSGKWREYLWNHPHTCKDESAGRSTSWRKATVTSSQVWENHLEWSIGIMSYMHFSTVVLISFWHWAFSFLFLHLSNAVVESEINSLSLYTHQSVKLEVCLR